MSHDRQFVDALAQNLLLIEKEKLIRFSGNLTAYQQAKTQPRPSETHRQEKLMIEMRLAELTARISSNPPDRETLETQWQDLVAKKRRLETL